MLWERIIDIVVVVFLSISAGYCYKIGYKEGFQHSKDGKESKYNA